MGNHPGRFWSGAGGVEGGLKEEFGQKEYIECAKNDRSWSSGRGASRHPLRLDAHSSPTSYHRPASFPWNTTSGARPLNHTDVKIQND